MIPAGVDPRLRKILEGFNPDCMMPGDVTNAFMALDALQKQGVDCFGLRDYAALKSRAMGARLAGYITQALNYERQCDKIYDALPEWARW